MSKYTAEQVIYAADLEQARYDGDLTISEYLRDYAALLRERESAKAAVTDEIFEAFDAAQTKAMGEYEMQQYHAGKESHLVNALDFATRAALEAVAPMLASARVSDDGAFSRGYVRGYEAALGAAAAECRRQAGALDHGGNEYIRYVDAIKCAAAIGSLRAPELNELSGISGRLAGVEIPDGAFVIDRGFQVERGQSIPTVLVGFRIEDWKARDTFASMLTAPKPETEE